MTDMRNSHPTLSTHAHTVLVDSDDVLVKDRYVLEEDGAGLGQFHYSGGEYAENQNGTAKVLGALVIALMVGAAGVYVYTTMPAQREDVVATADLPRPMGPGPSAAMTPVTAPAMDAMTEAGEAMTSEPATTAMEAPAVTTQVPARTAQAPVTAPANVAPMTATAPVMTPPVAPVMPQNQAASAIPEPVSPTPPASSLAGNPPLNEQSAAPADVTPAEPAQPASPVAPEVTPSEPVQPIQ